MKSVTGFLLISAIASVACGKLNITRNLPYIYSLIYSLHIFPYSISIYVYILFYIKFLQTYLSHTSSDVHCPDGKVCPDEATCCFMSSLLYGCCPYAPAVCCHDGLHCCPEGHLVNIYTYSIRNYLCNWNPLVCNTIPFFGSFFLRNM